MVRDVLNEDRTTDVGQVDRVPPGEALARYGQFLCNEGISIEDIDTAMKRVPWTEISELRGNQDVLKKISEAEALLRSLRKSLS